MIYLEKGQETKEKVDWNKIAYSLQKQDAHFTSEDIFYLKSIVQTYIFVEIRIKKSLKKIKKVIPHEQDAIKQIYTSLLNISSDNENIDSKLDVLKIIIYDIKESSQLEEIVEEYLVTLNKIYN